MAVKSIFFGELPVLTKGRSAATEALVSIRENGQVAFNSKAVADIFSTADVLVKWDGEGEVGTFPCSLFLVPVTPEQAKAERDKGPKGNVVLAIKSGKDGDEEKGHKGHYFSGAALLKKIGYDYGASGNQSFTITMGGPKKNAPMIHLPSAKLTPPVKQVRTRKAKEEPSPVAPAPATPPSLIEDADITV